MKSIEYTVKRIMATTPEEKAIVKSWGSLWSRFGILERTGKTIYLIFGDWSGYRSSQYRITHIDYAGLYAKSGDKPNDFFNGTVLFSDNTTMSVWVKPITRLEILKNGFYRKPSYHSLINDLLKSGKTYYDQRKEN